MGDPKRAALKPVLNKLSKLFPLLASNNQGEVFNTSQAIKRLLATVKLDFHDLTKMLAGGPDSALELLLKLLANKDPDILVRLAQEKLSFFCTTGGEVYATTNDNHRAIPANSEVFHDWLVAEFLSAMKRVCSSASVKSATRALQALARHGSKRRQEVYTRVAQLGGRIYINLANDCGEVVEIDATGWRIVNNPPVQFWCPAGMLALPVPQSGGSIGLLRPFINLSDADFVLFVTLLVDALHARSERPVGVLLGGEGRGKSSAAKIVQRLLDPREVGSGNPPTTPRELVVRAYNGSMLIFDNMSNLSKVISDAMCRLSSGVGSSTRKFFTDGEHFSVGGSRPIWMTAINNPITEPDLAERSVVLELLPVKVDRRLTNFKLWAEFEAQYALILGGLFDVASYGLRELSNVHVPKLPRLAEFAELGVSIENAFAAPGAFMKAFDATVAESTAAVVDADSVPLSVVAFMEVRGGRTWKGSASALMTELQINDPTEVRVTTWKSWPHDVREFGARLWKAQTLLRKAGIDLVKSERSPDKRRARGLELRRPDPEEAGQADPPDKAEREDVGTKLVVIRGK